MHFSPLLWTLLIHSSEWRQMLEKFINFFSWTQKYFYKYMWDFFNDECAYYSAFTYFNTFLYVWEVTCEEQY